ncbi:hypothetical protein [Sulfoacidibacillus thermotolerans]|uniref:Antirepressor protein C-terminal domain-containing protein n=1 Tax=Sulfoacidibacillus thermotolerans TaxID=1765684 RepID=A0A2U3CT85_SULT2|nr:hypothetical protein [Sulfoacidibacillus thermotolerans]PWI52214.1 hypothetical protein BM613_14140 [Sulfoacidibacillus thermotolerans]
MTEYDLIESRLRRDRLVEHLDVLDRVKALSALPDGLNVTVEMAANYYDVEKQTIVNLIYDYHSELEDDGLKVLRGNELKEFAAFLKKVANIGEFVSPKTRSLTLIPRRALLRIGMVLRDSEVAKAVRSYLLDVEKIARHDAPTVITKATKSAEQTDKMLSVREKNAEARLLDARRRQGQALQNIIDRYADKLSPQAIESLAAKSAELIAGEPVISLPAVEQHFLSCEQIAKRVGLFSLSGKPHKQAIAALLEHVETDEIEKLTVVEKNGAWQGTTVKYAESVVPKLLEYVEELGKPQVLKLDKEYRVAWH